MNATTIEYIITGGAGFIGSALVRTLNAVGIDSILIVDRLGTDNRWKNLQGLAFADYQDKDSFIKNLSDYRRAKAIFHMGACSATTEIDADYLMQNNYHYSKRLCKFAVEHGIAFTYASSAATYGALEVQDDSQPIESLRPLNMYGYSKQLFDLWAQRSGASQKIIGLKYFNVYGQGEHHKGDMRSLVHKAYGQILSTDRLRLFKSHREDYEHGMQQRDFICITDVAALTCRLGLALVAMLENGSALPQVAGLYNLGTGKARSFKDLALAVFDALGREPNIEYIDMPEAIRGQYQYYTQATTANLHKVLHATRFLDDARLSVERTKPEYIRSWWKHASFASLDLTGILEHEGNCASLEAGIRQYISLLKAGTVL